MTNTLELCRLGNRNDVIKSAPMTPKGLAQLLDTQLYIKGFTTIWAGDCSLDRSRLKSMPTWNDYNDFWQAYEPEKKEDTMNYFLITTNEDGETSVTRIADIDAFLRELADGEHGNPSFIDGRKPWPADPARWKGDMMLIRGEIVTPKPVEVVTKYKI